MQDDARATVNAVVLQAIRQDAEQLLFSTRPDADEIRCVAGGSARTLVRRDAPQRQAMAARIRQMADLQPAAAPQQGLIMLNVVGRQYDARVTFTPADGSEQVALEFALAAAGRQ